MDAGLKLRCMESVVGAKLRPRACYNSLAYNDILLNLLNQCIHFDISSKLSKVSKAQASPLAYNDSLSNLQLAIHQA